MPVSHSRRKEFTVFQLKQVPTKKRDASMFARVQKINKQWVAEQKKAMGVRNTAEALDEILTQVRLATVKKTAAKRSKKSAPPKKATTK